MTRKRIIDVPVLMYHRINPIVIDRDTVHVDKFIEQLEYLSNSGYQTITLSQYQDYLDGQCSMPAKPVILTFDDGYVDNHTYALPLLVKYQMKATVFVVAGEVGNYCSWLKKHDCNRLMTWEQLGEWLDAGMEIGGHTMNHSMLSRLSDKEIKHELLTSKELLERQLSTKVDFLCYPYGDFDDRVKALAKSTGYKGSLAIFDKVCLSHDDLYAIPRTGVASLLPLWKFKLKVSKFYRQLIALGIIKKKISNIVR